LEVDLSLFCLVASFTGVLLPGCNLLLLHILCKYCGSTKNSSQEHHHVAPL